MFMALSSGKHDDIYSFQLLNNDGSSMLGRSSGSRSDSNLGDKLLSSDRDAGDILNEYYNFSLYSKGMVWVGDTLYAIDGDYFDGNFDKLEATYYDSSVLKFKILHFDSRGRKTRF